MSNGFPQRLSGDEFCSIKYQQDGSEVWRGMRLSELLAHVAAGAPELWIASLPTTLPAKPGIPWNNAGLISIS